MVVSDDVRANHGSLPSHGWPPYTPVEATKRVALWLVLPLVVPNATLVAHGCTNSTDIAGQEALGGLLPGGSVDSGRRVQETTRIGNQYR